jgi:hypothetical protein
MHLVTKMLACLMSSRKGPGAECTAASAHTVAALDAVSARHVALSSDRYAVFVRSLVMSSAPRSATGFADVLRTSFCNA